jgi:SagB-type dehydrogenase family enzyme
MTNPGHDFMLKTRLPGPSKSDQSQGLPQPPLELPPAPSQPLLDLLLPEKLDMPTCDLRTVIEGRNSVRKYANDPLTLEELSYLLWCTQGVKAVTDRPATKRTVPSAGARHAFETYLLINTVEGIQPGLYRFVAIEHKLAAVDLSVDVAQRAYEAHLFQDHIKTCAVLFMWTAVVYRMLWRYPDRGYRYLLLDAGHVCQNLYLVAESLGCGVCALGAFHDEQLNALLGLDGQEQFVVYCATVGKKVASG